MWICKHCEEEFNFIEIHEKANHSRWCKENPKLEDYKKSSIQAIKAMNKKKKELGVSNQFDKAKKEGKIINHVLKGKKAPQFSHRHSDKTKIIMSEKRKIWLSNNPEKHPWKNSSKFISEPCEFLKERLRENGFKFEEEYQPLKGRFFSLDIAFPKTKIGIEINGNQHYKKDGSLKKYYEDRHNIIEKSGWKLIEFHYLDAYRKDIIEMIKIITLNSGKKCG